MFFIENCRDIFLVYEFVMVKFLKNIYNGSIVFEVVLGMVICLSERVELYVDFYILVV